MTDLELATDLQVFIENDNTLYNTLYLPLLKNYQKLLDKGEFNADTAVKGLKHVTLAAGKKYLNNFSLDKTFNIRYLTAKLLVGSFLRETELGERFE